MEDNCDLWQIDSDFDLCWLEIGENHWILDTKQHLKKKILFFDYESKILLEGNPEYVN